MPSPRYQYWKDRRRITKPSSPASAAFARRCARVTRPTGPLSLSPAISSTMITLLAVFLAKCLPVLALFRPTCTSSSQNPLSSTSSVAGDGSAVEGFCGDWESDRRADLPRVRIAGARKIGTGGSERWPAACGASHGQHVLGLKGTLSHLPRAHQRTVTGRVSLRGSEAAFTCDGRSERCVLPGTLNRKQVNVLFRVRQYPAR